jgi:hypothetical protein
MFFRRSISSKHERFYLDVIHFPSPFSSKSKTIAGMPVKSVTLKFRAST